MIFFHHKHFLPALVRVLVCLRKRHSILGDVTFKVWNCRGVLFLFTAIIPGHKKTTVVLVVISLIPGFTRAQELMGQSETID